MKKLSAARPPAGSPCLPRSSQAGTSQAGLSRQHGTRGLCCLQTRHLRHGHAQRRLRSLHAGWCMFCFFVVCCCVGVPVVDVGMCVSGAACSARCGVLQRHHNFDAFLKRLGKRQPQELVRHWIRTATRHSLSDDSLCGIYVSHDSDDHG